VLSLPFKVNYWEVVKNRNKERECEKKFPLPRFKIINIETIFFQKKWLKGKHFIAPYRNAE
jgi:hypothetical protein